MSCFDQMERNIFTPLQDHKFEIYLLSLLKTNLNTLNCNKGTFKYQITLFWVLHIQFSYKPLNK